MSACTIHATLAEHAHASHHVADSRLHLVLHIPGCRTGVLATLHYNGLGAQGFAARDALRLRPGDLVTVYCAGFGTDADGRQRLFGVDHMVQHVRDCQGVVA